MTWAYTEVSRSAIDSLIEDRLRCVPSMIDYARMARAEALVATAVFTRIKDPGLKKGFSAYEVRVGTILMGVVKQDNLHTYKMAGRLRYGDQYLKRWIYEAEGQHRMGRDIHYDTRKQAAMRLIEVQLERGLNLGA